MAWIFPGDPGDRATATTSFPRYPLPPIMALSVVLQHECDKIRTFNESNLRYKYLVTFISWGPRHPFSFELHRVRKERWVAHENALPVGRPGPDGKEVRGFGRKRHPPGRTQHDIHGRLVPAKEGSGRRMRHACEGNCLQPLTRYTRPPRILHLEAPGIWPNAQSSLKEETHARRVKRISPVSRLT